MASFLVGLTVSALAWLCWLCPGCLGPGLAVLALAWKCWPWPGCAGPGLPALALSWLQSQESTGQQNKKMKEMPKLVNLVQVHFR